MSVLHAGQTVPVTIEDRSTFSLICALAGLALIALVLLWMVGVNITWTWVIGVWCWWFGALMSWGYTLRRRALTTRV